MKSNCIIIDIVFSISNEIDHKFPFYLRWQFSLNNSLNVGDNILGGHRGAVEVGYVSLRDALDLLLRSILLFLLVVVPLEAPLARIKSDKD